MKTFLHIDVLRIYNFEHKHFCAQILLHTNAFIFRQVYTLTPLFTGSWFFFQHRATELIEYKRSQSDKRNNNFTSIFGDSCKKKLRFVLLVGTPCLQKKKIKERMARERKEPGSFLIEQKYYLQNNIVKIL